MVLALLCLETIPRSPLWPDDTDQNQVRGLGSMMRSLKLSTPHHGIGGYLIHVSLAFDLIC